MTEHPPRLPVVTLLGTGIVEADIPKLDRSAGPARRPGKRTRPRGLDEHRLRVEDVQQPRHGCGAPLEEIDDPAERDERPGEHTEVEAEGDERAHADRTANGERAAKPEHRDHADAREQYERRMHGAVESRQPHVLLEVLVVHPVEATDFRRLLAVRPNDAHAGEILLGERRQIAEVFLDGLESFMDASPHPDTDGWEEKQWEHGDAREARIDP